MAQVNEGVRPLSPNDVKSIHRISGPGLRPDSSFSSQALVRPVVKTGEIVMGASALFGCSPATQEALQQKEYVNEIALTFRNENKTEWHGDGADSINFTIAVDSKTGIPHILFEKKGPGGEITIEDRLVKMLKVVPEGSDKITAIIVQASELEEPISGENWFTNPAERHDVIEMYFETPIDNSQLENMSDADFNAAYSRLEVWDPVNEVGIINEGSEVAGNQNSPNGETLKVLFNPSSSDIAKEATVVPTTEGEQAPTAVPTILPTLEPTPAIPSIEVEGVQIPDPKVTNPELFDTNNKKSLIAKYIHAFGLNPSEVGELTPVLKTGVDGKRYVFMVTGDSPLTTTFDESRTALVIGEQKEDGGWIWRNMTLADTEKITGIQHGILFNLSSEAQPIVSEQFNLGVSYVGWPYTEAEQNKFTFNESNFDYQFAREKNMDVGGHMLIWGMDAPDWVRQKANSPDELKQIMLNHMDKIIDRYKGRTDYWVVVNEAGAKSYSSGGGDIFYQVLGEQYIYDAFQEARLKDPGAKLVYGDYFNYFGGGETRKDFILQTVAKLKEKGLIDAVGLQVYTRMDQVDLEKLRTDLADLKALGVPVYIDEFSVVMRRDATPEAKLKQAEVTRQIMQIFKESGIVTKVVTWGLTDELTNSISGEKDNSGFFELDAETNTLVPKPNFFAVLNVPAE